MRGGKRPGAGRKPGSRNKATTTQRKRALKSGVAPLDYLLSVMRNAKTPRRERIEAAKAAAQYVHPKLSAVTMKGEMNVRRIERVVVDPANRNATSLPPSS